MSRENEGFPMALATPVKPYRMLMLFAAYGYRISYLAGAVVLLGALALWQVGYGFVWVPVGAVLAVFAVVMLSCFAELVDLIVDTMIPK